MKTVEFIGDFEIYPDGVQPVRVVAGQSLEVSDEYAELLAAKGHIKTGAAPRPVVQPAAAPAAPVTQGNA